MSLAIGTTTTPYYYVNTESSYGASSTSSASPISASTTTYNSPASPLNASSTIMTASYTTTASTTYYYGSSSSTPTSAIINVTSTTPTTSSTTVKDMESRIIHDMYSYLGYGCSVTPKDASMTLYNSYGENTVSINISRTDTDYLNSVGYMQILLKNLNYYNGSIDKVYDTELNNSLQQFQKDYNMSVTSSATPKTFDNMVSVLYNRCRGLSTSSSVLTDLDRLGIYLDDIKFGQNSTVKEVGPVKAQAYTVVSNESKLKDTFGYFTEYEYNLLIAQVAHEAGTVSITNCYGVASAILNLSEQQYNGNVVDCINNSCVKFESPKDALYSNYISKQNGTLYTNISGDKLATAKIAVDAAISGLRAFSSQVQYWVGNGSYNRFSTTYQESANF